VTTTEFWQIALALLAIAFALGAALRLVRTPRWQIVVLLAQIILVPEAALVVAVLHPGPMPDVNRLLAVVAVFGGAAFLGIGWSLYQRRQMRRPSVPLAVVDRQHLAAVVSRLLVVGMTSGFLFTFAPGFAVANLLLNAAWLALWIPRRWRRVNFEVTDEIRAPLPAVFAAAIDTSRWNDVQDGSVVVEPPGSLKVGSRIVRRQKLRPLVPNPRMAGFLESRSVVTSVEPDRGYTVELMGNPSATGGVDLVDAAGQTRVRSWSRGMLTLRDAVAGLYFELPDEIAIRKAEMRKSVERLKQSVEAARNQ
jgi:hypothetical protein